MAAQRWEQPGYGGNGTQSMQPDGQDPSIGELFKRLSSDTGDLLQQEIALAKAEAREMARNARRAATRMAIAAGLALAGLLALTAFAVIGLGNALGGAYWLSSLIVAAVALGAGALLARRAGEHLSAERMAPRESAESLKEDARWAQREARELKRDIRNPTPATHNRG
jgi:uncharacterized membrane protein YqjE